MTDVENEDESNRFEVDIIGRNLGTASGWDGEPGECIWFYEFWPHDGIELENGDLQIDFNSDAIGIQTEEGGIRDPKPLIEFLNGVAKQ